MAGGSKDDFLEPEAVALTQDVYMALILSLLSGMRHREAAETLTGKKSPFLGLHKEPE